ncbi:helicase SRCAP isoform X2 [Centropristis striata]|uniref:helicase SRCAP isoform X2 n=1 Tax=Centropristis striata TaxID=184440 RepID=UPI0027E09128|nr:helicase SRCAP isoform X2 [Centropristis striata]
MQRLPAPLCPALAPETQNDSTVQELQYGSQTDKEKSHSKSQPNQIQPPREGLVVITGAKQKQSVALEYKPETGTIVEEHTGGNIHLQPRAQICFTAPSPSPSVPQSGVGFKVPDTAEHGADRDPLATQGSHKPKHQDSKPPLPSPSNSEIKQTDLSKTQPRIIREVSADARGNSLEPVEMFEHVKELVDSSHTETQPPSAEILETPKAGELLAGLHTKGSSASSGAAGRDDGDIQSSVRVEQTDASSSDFTMLPECSSSSSAQESCSKPSAAPSLFHTGLRLQVVEAETSHPSDQLPTADTELSVHSAETQEIVVVREEAHISGDWSSMHLNQSYLLQREDGSVCQAAIVNTGEPKLYGEGVQADMELDSQPVEVYQFCTLVEDVAEETVCASGSAQMPHSPGYEVNLFNALLEHSEDLEPSIHTINEGGTVIISQQLLPSSHDANQSSNSHHLSIQTTRTTGHHVVLDARQAVEVANSSEVCLVEVTAESFSPQIVTSCSQVSEKTSKHEAEAGGALSLISPGGEAAGTESPVAVSSLNQTVSATKREASVSSHEGTKDAAALTETLSQSVQNVPAETKPEALRTALSSGIINPKLLLLKPGETPILKHPPSLLLSKKQDAASGRLANAHSSWSATVSEECLPKTVPDSLRVSPVNKTSVSAAQPAASDHSLQLVAPATSTSKPDKEALNVTETSHKASQDAAPNALYVLSASGAGMASDEPATGQSDSLYVEEESEDMEQDEPMGDAEAQETSGQLSSPDEGSDDEPDGDKTESEMTTPSSPHQVRQWISDRVTANSSPVSPSTSSSYAGPSPSSDWSTPRREKSSLLLRGPHGKFVSPSSVGGYSSSSSPPDQSGAHRARGERHTDMAELAKHEADIEHRTQSMKREGFWSMKRLTRLTEPPRPKVHWDYLCEEMQWLSADFAQERRWKRGVARKVVRMVMRHHEELRQKEEKAKRDEHAKIRRVASSIAKEVRAFWSSVEKVVQYKQQSRLEEKRKKALDLQLDFIVGQTEKYSDLLSKSLAPSRPAETEPEPEAVPQTPHKSAAPAIDEEDRDFEPPCEEEDDEETIEVEEQQEGNDAESHRREIELLKEEGLLPLDQLLSTLKLPQESGSDEECSDETSSSAEEEEEDGEFTANEEDAEDEEDTIAAQEKVEGNVDHGEELDDLAREGDMSVEELLEKYKGAYASDFEAPSASGSKESSESEESGDEEEESEEDESDVESNSSSSDSPGDSGDDDDDDSEESEEEEDDGCGDEGMEVLLKEGDNSPPASSSRPKKEISHIAATAESLQPKGYTLATTKVKTPIPFLLHGTLREYQHIGLDWLVTMYEKKLNGILADEMGLGKTIQTIALLAHLACEKGNWGPHLIIVPTSVMLNWEMELKRWCPGFKILTYFGSQKERKLKRQGWTKPNAFHVCITSYKLVLQDHQAFRRKSWRYLILDEAQNIKNFKSQRWQSLLNFNSHRRLLLTGTPLQNSLMELWSLMHFLMPHVFQSHREFKEWFSNPLTGMIEGSQEYNEGLVKRLHKVLRPFLLRRIKIDVEKQMPKKYEHVVRCRLSKRQRFLYDDFMAQASTRETLASGHFMSVINILMQLRKVCNHPNLFDPRPIQSPFITQPIVFHTASLVQDALEVLPLKRCDLSMFDLVGLESRVSRYQADIFLPRHKVSRQLIQEIVESPDPPPRPKPVRMKVNRMFQPPPKSDNRPVLLMNKPTCSVPPAAQTPKPPPVMEVASTPAAAPVVQQVVCSVATAAPPRPSLHPSAQTAVRSSAPKPVLTVRPPTASCTASIPAHPSPNPTNVLPQRVLLSPDMQARLPSGEVVSIAQLASLAGRPVSSCQGSKPVTFQLQGNKLTLSGAQIHQVPAASPRPVQGNVMHLVSSGVQHHLISQPAPLAVQNSGGAHPANAAAAHNAAAQVAPSLVSSPGVVKIVVRQTSGKDGGPVPTLAVAPSPRVAPQASPSPHPHATAPPVRTAAPLQLAQRSPGPATAHYTIAPPGNPSPAPNQPHPPRPVLKVVQPPAASTEPPAPVQVSSSSSSSSVSKSSAATRDASSSSQTPVTSKSRPSTAAKSFPARRRVPRPPPRSPFHMSWLSDSYKHQRDSRLDFIFRVNENRCAAKPMYGREVLDFLTFLPGPRPSPAPLSAEGEWGRSGQASCLFAQWQNKFDLWFQSHAVREAIHSVEERLELLKEVVDRFTFAIPPVEAPQISMHCCHPPPSLSHHQTVFSSLLSSQVTPLTRSLHRIQCNMRTQFPDLRLIQYDCGKLQTLHTLLRKLKTGGHRVLIFTQMTRMLDVLEQFLNYHGHIYLRLDGSTRVEQRQSLMERFNADRRIFCFILSTRSGGVGVNLTGADTVVFYDSDWNPTMDAQAQDRCHRIGQTRDVHIYRLISERTVEENILKKANQKRMLGDMAIEGGNFTTAFFKQQTIRELFDMNEGEKREAAVELTVAQNYEEENVSKQSTTILEQALCRAEDEEDIVAASQAKAEQVAELAEFNENIPLDDGAEQEEVEELSKAEQEIAALVEQLTPIERYAMNFLEASLEDVCKEELKQAEEQVEAARKGLDQAKEEGLKLHASSDEDDDDFLSTPASVEPAQPARRGRKPKDKEKVVTSTRTSGRLRGASPDTEPEPAAPREVPERPRCGLRGRAAAKDSVSPPSSHHKTSSSSTRTQDSSRSTKASSPARDHQKTRTLPNRGHPSPVPSPPTASPPAGRPPCETSRSCRDEQEGENEVSESLLESGCPDHQVKDEDSKDHMSPPSTSSRSPRKRQSADGEVLRGLVEDSPSAKVLRKLPGRLVTVVEEKEPRRRRRRGSGTGGGASSEEATVEENTTGLTEEPNKDNNMSPSPDSKTKVIKSPQDQDSTPSPPVQLPPVRSYPPYSPPHLASPDMPVLRNLPVRRRLETESRMAAQLGEQQQLLGRGRGSNQSRKTDKDATSPENSLGAPLKRKRGRPPKTPLRLPESDNTLVVPSPQPTSPTEEGNPPLSPKRKRGRPRKDSTTTPETIGEEQDSKNEPANSNTSGEAKTDASSEPTNPETPAAAVTTNQDSQSTKPEETDTTTAPPPAPAADIPSTPAAASVAAPAPSAAAPSVSSAPAPPQLSSASFATLSATPVTTPPPASTITSPPQSVKFPLVVSSATVPAEPKPSTTVKTTGPESAKATTPPPPAAPTPSPSSVAPVPTTITTTAASQTVSVTPAVTTTVRSVTTTTSAVKNLQEASTLLSTISTPAAVPSTPPIASSPAPLTSVSAPIPSTAPIASSPAPLASISAPVPSTPPKASSPAPQASISAPVPSTAPITSSPAPRASISAPVPSTAAATSAPAPLTSTLAPITSLAPATPTPAPLASPPAPVTSTAAPVTSPLAATQKVSAASSPKPPPTCSPSTAPTMTTTTTVKTVQTNPSNSASLSPVPSAGPSATASVKTVSSSAANTAPPSSSSSHARTNVTPTKVLTKPASPSAAPASAPVVGSSSTKPPATPTPRCTPPLAAATPASVTPAASAKTVTVTPSPPTEKVQVPPPVAAASPSKEHTATPPAAPAEQTVKISPPVAVSTGAAAAPAAAPPTEKSVKVAPQECTTAAASVSAAAAFPSVSTTQTAAAFPLQVQSSDVPTSAQTETSPRPQTSSPSPVSAEKQSADQTKKASESDPDRVTDMDVEAGAKTSEKEEEKKEDMHQAKKRKVESSSETKESGAQREETKQQEVDKAPEDEKTPIQKRPLSRSSSQDSTRSSSPSSGCSTSTLTRHAHHKRTYENRHPAKKRRMDVTSETGQEETNTEGGAKEGDEEELTSAASRGRRSRSSSSSSDSDTSESRKERRLTRSSKHKLQDQEREKGSSREGKKPARSSDRHTSNNANASTGGESGSDTSSVRTTRKSAGSQPPPESKAQTNSAPPEPEVLGKRCSALNAAAKLLAMKGRVDTPGHMRRDSGAKAAATSDKNQKSKSKSVPASPQSNSVTNNKSSGSSKPSPPNQTSRPPSRSTRQCPGSLVPPLEVEYKRTKAEEKRRSGGKEGGEAEAQPSSRGHSACSSMSSDGEGEGGGGGGGRSSRSRSSSSNSSQRTRSISSQNTERRESRAASSGSERDRSSESSRRSQSRSQKLPQEAPGGSGAAEGTPDRVLRSVAALAAVQARSPAASTRSSSGQHRHNKT